MKIFIAFIDYCYAAALKVMSCFASSGSRDLNPELDTIVLIPGVYETSLYFKTVIKYIPKTFNVIHAESIYGKSKGVRHDSRSICNYIKSHKLTGVTIIGHSSGGLTAVNVLNLLTSQVSHVLTVATPFNGVLNGHILRTKIVRELLPDSEIIDAMKRLPLPSLDKIVSIYPSFDNQVWSKRGSHLPNAKNVKVNASGHHLILRSDNLKNAILAEL